MIKQFFVGVDGGATKCTVRVEDATGQLLGQATSGPANIRISTEQAWRSIHAALKKALLIAGFSEGWVDSALLASQGQQNREVAFYVGMGLAGCEIASAKHAFLQYSHPFQQIALTSDAHTACLGAHAGADGAIIIIGTGVVGFKVEDNELSRVSGWGFPHDDLGGGAWLGLEAVKVALQANDDRLPASSLADAVLAHFKHDHKAFVQWANEANSTAFATLAPIVIRQSEQQDSIAIDLLKRAAREIDRVSDALRLQALPCSLIGGIAPYIEPYLKDALRQHLQPCKASPDAGAILLMRHKKDV